MTDTELPEWLRGLDTSPTNPILTLLKKSSNMLNIKSNLWYINESGSLTSEERILLKTTQTLQGLIEHALAKGIDLEKIVKHLDWKSFEILTSAILTASGWETITNFRFISPQKRTSRLEFDVIAEDPRTNSVLLIDCKRYKTPSLAPIRTAVEKQKERTYMLLNMIPEIHGSIDLKFPQWDRFTFYPLILTWRNHGIQFHDGIPIVKVSSFLDFLNSFDTYREMSFKIVQDF